MATLHEEIMSAFRYRPEILQDVEEFLIGDLKKFEDWFLLDSSKLKEITDHFVEELNEGLTEKGGNIPMNITWVMTYPTGNEEGRFLTLDMGGTNLRVCEVSLSQGQREADEVQRKYKLPNTIKTATGEELWDWVAERIQEFVHEHHSGGQGATSLPLAFTFSFPVEQKNIRSGVLQRWTKNFNVSGVEGHDIVPQLEAALERKKVPVKVVALINDTTGTLIASHYRDPEVKVGCVFSTGCNAAYMEDYRSIPKLHHLGLPDDVTVMINTEYGAFDCDLAVLPITSFDRQIDHESVHPGTQRYEKMVSGLYIGEMLRLILVSLHEEGKLFDDQNVTRLRSAYTLDARFLSHAEQDVSRDLHDMRNAFVETLNLNTSLDELKVCRYLIELIATRAARLYACGIAAICKKQGLASCHIGVDGSVFNKYHGFKQRAKQALREILDWSPNEPDSIILIPSEDGSSVGAALAAALATNGDHGGMERIGTQNKEE